MTNALNGFDFHCHVDLFPDPAALIADCERSRIFTVAVTTTPKTWAQNQRWTADSRLVFAAIGLHPELVGQRQSEIGLLEQLMAQTPFVGEIGLDGSRPHRSTFAAQEEVFSRALQSAERLGGRVLSIHSRRAGREALAALARHTTPERVLPVLHWFSDSVRLAAEAASLGCYFSVNHRMLATDSGKALVKGLPTERLLTETDGPFTEVADRKSEPRDVSDTVAHLALIRGVPLDGMKQTIQANAERVLAFAGISIPATRP